MELPETYGSHQEGTIEEAQDEESKCMTDLDCVGENKSCVEGNCGCKKVDIFHDPDQIAMTRMNVIRSTRTTKCHPYAECTNTQAG